MSIREDFGFILSNYLAARAKQIFCFAIAAFLKQNNREYENN
jgi:hypothetical protein